MVVWDTLCFHSTLCCRDNAVFFGNYQILFQTADIDLLFANIVPEVCLFVILHRKSARLVQELILIKVRQVETVMNNTEFKKIVQEITSKYGFMYCKKNYYYNSDKIIVVINLSEL